MNEEEDQKGLSLVKMPDQVSKSRSSEENLPQISPYNFI
jgi:hypothetical protein